MVFDGPEFKKLKARWYQKLAASGFTDLEDDNGRLELDRHPDHGFAKRIGYRQDLLDDRAKYFAWASQMLHETRFKNPKPRRIWALHAEGKTSREIQAVTGTDQTCVCRMIKRIKKYLGKGF